MKRLVWLAAFLYLAQFWPANQTPAIAAEDIVRLVKDVKPAVVLIQTFDAEGQPSGSASGFFINNKVHIITNHHVIEGACSATVKTSSGREYAVEGIVARDIEADIVKLSVNIQDTNITPLKLSTTIPSEGENVIVIGNPLGLEASVSTGIVSAVRDIPAFGKILQITAPVSPGSSGSPVLNTKGEVIGVATFIATEGQNINFAVPSEKILTLKETEKTSLLKEYAAGTVDANDTEKLYQSGLTELWKEKWADALTYFQKATAKNPQDADAWLCVGYCYGKLGRWQEALDCFKQAIRIKPDLAEAHYNLGVSYGKLGRYAEEIDCYKQAIRIKPDYAEAYSNLGVAYGKLGRYQEALDCFKQAIRIKPDYAEAHCGLGTSYGGLSRWQEAIESCKQAIRIKPDYANAHYALGLVYLITGDKGSALEEYKILKTLDIEKANKLFNAIYK
jgi:Flp pilus assembly protein TadD